MDPAYTRRVCSYVTSHLAFYRQSTHKLACAAYDNFSQSTIIESHLYNPSTSPALSPLLPGKVQKIRLPRGTCEGCLAYVWLKTMDGFERLEEVLATYGTYKILI